MHFIPTAGSRWSMSAYVLKPESRAPFMHPPPINIGLSDISFCDRKYINRTVWLMTVAQKSQRNKKDGWQILTFLHGSRSPMEGRENDGLWNCRAIWLQFAWSDYLSAGVDGCLETGFDWGGIWKAFKELKKWAGFEGALPKMVPCSCKCNRSKTNMDLSWIEWVHRSQSPQSLMASSSPIHWSRLDDESDQRVKRSAYSVTEES